LQAILASTGTAWTHALLKFQFQHLGVGKVVSALVDGGVVTGLVVDADGNVTLPEPGELVTIGLPYVSEIETLDISIDGRGQTVQKISGEAFVEVVNSRGLWIGEDRNRMREWAGRTVAHGTPNMSAATPLQTTKDSIKFSGGWGHSGHTICQARDPLPVEIVALTPIVTFGG
jgi:hypothetical protein